MNSKTIFKNFFALPVMLFFLGVYILPLGVRPLFIPDETRYAEVPREMIVSGDWIVPHLNGLRYFEKPAMGYWAIALSESLLGFNNFSVRLPLSLSAGLTALVLLFLVRFAVSQNHGAYTDDGASETAAPLSMLIYLSCGGVAVIANIAVLDNLLAFFLTVCMAAFFTASEAIPSSRCERAWLVVAGIACGCAFLTKGFLAFAVPGLVMGPYLIWQKRLLDLPRMAWLLLATSVVTALPWALMIHAREPDFWCFFFWHEHVRRFFSQHAQHVQPLWFYALIFPLLAMPWSLVIPAALAGVRQNKLTEKTTRLAHFCICWFVFPFMFYSLCRGKLATYILPCFAPFVILMSLGLAGNADSGKTRRMNYGIIGFMLIVSLISVGLIVIQLFFPPDLRPYQTTWKWICAGSIGIVATPVLLHAVRLPGHNRKISLLALGVAILLAPANFLIPRLILVAKSPTALLRDSLAKLDLQAKDAIILSGKKPIRAVCWFFRRSDVIQVGYGGELQYGLEKDATKRRILQPKDLRKLIKDNPGKVILAAKQKRYEKWYKLLPPPRAVYSAGHSDFVVAFY